MEEGSNDSLIPADIVTEILSRLSAKALLRFKSVSKNWFNIIIHPFFVQKYQSRQGFFLVVPPDNNYYNVHTYEWDRRFYTIDWNKKPMDRVTVHDPSVPFSVNAVTDIVNGLVCFYHRRDEEGFIFVYNLTTREILPLPTPPRRSSIERICRLGFDPINKEYKLIHTWRPISTPGVRTASGCCEVCIMGKDNAWRSIDISDFVVDTFYRWGDLGFCHDRVIYWISYNSRSETSCIVAFDVGHEKFDYINYPQDEVVRGDEVSTCHIGGYLSIVSISWETERYSSDTCNYEISITLWRLMDENSNSERPVWNKEVIMCPFHNYVEGEICCSDFGLVSLVKSGKQLDLAVIDCYDLTTRKHMVLKVNKAQGFLNPIDEHSLTSFDEFRPMALVKNLMPLKSNNIEEGPPCSDYGALF